MPLVFPKVVLTLVAYFQLAQIAQEQWPKQLKTSEQAIVNTMLAVSLATDDLDPLLILAVARVESGFRPHRTSWKDGRTGKRLTGNWLPRERDDMFVAPYFCGVMQAKALSWHDCIELRDLRTGYAKGIAELVNWKQYCETDLRCVLAGHGGGWAPIRRVKAEARRRYHRNWKARGDKKPPYWWRVLDERDQLRERLASPSTIW